ncbi:hypothetical protein HNR73_005908 [Phytomonospora endophytica]|uniref:Uncharacterized protein n=1 Tax=Phytomonospora endophytica TaxID=714109 RepID=A0A841FWB9_9ACTN|nr:hypothetical protein [Phytomonospora endophytica]
MRVGALHALDALGQEHEGRRRVVMDIWCAYLRMPPPGIKPDAEQPAIGQTRRRGRAPLKPRAKAKAWPADELNVRATAQCLIAHHLRPPAKQREKKESRSHRSLLGRHGHRSHRCPPPPPQPHRLPPRHCQFL